MHLRPKHFTRALGAWLFLASLVGGCASVGRAPRAGKATALAAPHLDVAALRQRIEQAQLPLAQLHADVRLVSFGPEGRLRGQAEVYVQRPDHLRYTLMGPQGGPIIVLVSDGQTLRGVDMRQRRYVVGPADAEQFDAWLSPVHLRLDTRGWVRVLLGELDVPPSARSAAGAPPGSVALSWSMPAGQRIWAAFGQKDARLREVRLCRGESVASRVSIAGRDASGVPERLRIEHVHLGNNGVSQIELSLRQIDTTRVHASDVYSLMPPDGFAIIAPPPVASALGKQ